MALKQKKSRKENFSVKSLSEKAPAKKAPEDGNEDRIARSGTTRKEGFINSRTRRAQGTRDHK